MRKARVARLPRELNWPPSGAAVVIDVLRATSVIAQALAAGATEVIVCGEISDALELADRADRRPLLCGERACTPIEGFDLGNSPAEYTAAQVRGKSLVMTTTNGTRAAIAAAAFESIYAASFNNFSAVLARLATEPEVSLICAGTDGERTAEDLLLAGALLQGLAERNRGELSPLGEAETEALTLWREHLASGRDLADSLRQTLGGRNLLAKGYERDVETCAVIDSLGTVAVVRRRAPITFQKSP